MLTREIEIAIKLFAPAGLSANGERDRCVVNQWNRLDRVVPARTPDADRPDFLEAEILEFGSRRRLRVHRRDEDDAEAEEG